MLRCWFRGRLRCSNDDIINDMNDTITGSDISSDNINSLTVIDYLNSTFFSFDKAYSFSSKSLNISSGNISSHNSGSSNNMSCNNSFGLFRGKAFKSTFWKFGKSFIGWSKNGDSFNSLQGFNKTKIADNFDQSGESTSSDGNIYNISNISSSCNGFWGWSCRFHGCWSHLCCMMYGFPVSFIPTTMSRGVTMFYSMAMAIVVNMCLWSVVFVVTSVSVVASTWQGYSLNKKSSRQYC